MIPKNELPKYSITLPAAKKTIEYRPFTVGEEQILLIAMETGDINQFTIALNQIFELCTFGKCKLDGMVQVDAEYLFINIRNKSLGEGLEVIHNCENPIECDSKNSLDLNLEDISVEFPEKMDNNIKIADGVIITLSYPTLSNTMSINDKKSTIRSLATCIDSLMIEDKIYVKEDVKIDDFIEYLQGLTQKQLDMLEEYLKTMPKVVFNHKYTCKKCGFENNIHIEGINDFFV